MGDEWERILYADSARMRGSDGPSFSIGTYMISDAAKTKVMPVLLAQFARS